MKKQSLFAFPEENSGPPQFHTPLSSTHQVHTKWPLLFSPQNSSVPHQKPLSSTLNIPQFHRPLSSALIEFITEDNLFCVELREWN